MQKKPEIKFAEAADCGPFKSNEVIYQTQPTYEHAPSCDGIYYELQVVGIRKM
jgi:hypothetical protein